MYITITIFVVLICLFILFFHFRKKKIIKKICCMPVVEKSCLLNELIKPFGYSYDVCQNVFTSRTDAWQKDFGYRKIYDRIAPFFNMIFDCLPVYFNYDEKTWLIEFWKGQYGINIGAETGIYCADAILSPAACETAVFTGVNEEEFLHISMALFYKGHLIAKMCKPHWWLTIFSMGRYSNPKNLSLEITLDFPDFEMRNAFINALNQSGYYKEGLDFCLCHTSVSLTFYKALKKRSFISCLYSHYVLFKDWLFCKLYCFITRPFQSSSDKLLYLYYYIPFVFRRMLRLKRFTRHTGKERL